jgi:hypothetical protein
MHGFTDQEVKQCFLYIFYRHNTNQTHRRFIKSLSYRERIVSAAFIPCIVPSSCVSIGPSKPTLGIRQGRAASGARNARTVRRTWIRDNAFSLHGHLLRTRAMVGRVKSDRLLDPNLRPAVTMLAKCANRPGDQLVGRRCASHCFSLLICSRPAHSGAFWAKNRGQSAGGVGCFGCPIRLNCRT